MVNFNETLYKLYIQSYDWRIKKNEYINSLDNSQCEVCKINEWEEVHHQNYDSLDYENPWNELDKHLLYLCKKCHNEIHTVTGKHSSKNQDMEVWLVLIKENLNKEKEAKINKLNKIKEAEERWDKMSVIEKKEENREKYNIESIKNKEIALEKDEKKKKILLQEKANKERISKFKEEDFIKKENEKKIEKENKRFELIFSTFLLLMFLWALFWIIVFAKWIEWAIWTIIMLVIFLSIDKMNEK